MKKIITLLSLMTVSISLFGFGLPSVPGLDKSSDSQASSGPSAEVAQESLVRDYCFAAANVLRAQQNFLKAFGLKDEANKLEVSATKLESGSAPSKQDLADAKEVSDEANKKIKELTSKQADLSEEGKEYYRAAMPYMIQAIRGTVALTNTAKDFLSNAKAEIKGAGLGGALKLKTKLEAGMFVAPKIPKLIGDTTKNFKSMLTYGKNNNILNPDDYQGEAVKGLPGVS